MHEDFIKEIEIKKYKLFDDFKANGFHRVNLIGGKNNAGKTAFMEACYLSQATNTGQLFERLLEIKTHRNLINQLLSKTSREEDIRALVKDNIGLEIDLKGERIEYNEKSGDAFMDEYMKIQSHLGGLTNIVNNGGNINVYVKKNDIFDPEIFQISDLISKLDIYLESTKIKFSPNFISAYSNSDKELEEIIGESKLQNKYTVLNTYLDEVFGITSIDIIKNRPMLQVDGEYKELASFGQGIKTFINTIGAILLLNDDMIFLDEIENGIHYTNLDKLWEIILTVSKSQNVQVFATTHSKECIESYARVSKKLEDSEIGFIELGYNKEGKLDSTILDSEMFLRFIDLDNEVRGW